MHPDETDVVEFIETADEPAANPIVQALREQREKHLGDHFHDVEVPGYNGLFVIRCGPLGGRQLTIIQERVDRSKSPDKLFNVNADTLIAGCREVLGRVDLEDDLVTITDHEGEPVRIDVRLAEVLQLQAETSRDVIRAVFGLANDPDVAVGVAAGTYMEWCSSANGAISEAVLGES